MSNYPLRDADKKAFLDEVDARCSDGQGTVLEIATELFADQCERNRDLKRQNTAILDFMKDWG